MILIAIAIIWFVIGAGSFIFLICQVDGEDLEVWGIPFAILFGLLGGAAFLFICLIILHRKINWDKVIIKGRRR